MKLTNDETLQAILTAGFYPVHTSQVPIVTNTLNHLLRAKCATDDAAGKQGVRVARPNIQAAIDSAMACARADSFEVVDDEPAQAATGKQVTRDAEQPAQSDDEQMNGADRSVAVNRITWKLAEAMGRVADGADAMQMDIAEVVNAACAILSRNAEQPFGPLVPLCHISQVAMSHLAAGRDAYVWPAPFASGIPLVRADVTQARIDELMRDLRDTQQRLVVANSTSNKRTQKLNHWYGRAQKADGVLFGIHNALGVPFTDDCLPAIQALKDSAAQAGTVPTFDEWFKANNGGQTFAEVHEKPEALLRDGVAALSRALRDYVSAVVRNT